MYIMIVSKIIMAHSYPTFSFFALQTIRRRKRVEILAKSSEVVAHGRPSPWLGTRHVVTDREDGKRTGVMEVDTE